MADLTPIYEVLGQAGEHPRLTPGRLCLQLQQHLSGRLAFNELTLEPEIDSQRIPVHAVDTLYVALSERGWSIDKVKAKDALVRAARANSYHPVALYLEHVAADEGIEPVDLTTLATDYLGTADRLYDEMLAATLIGAVARALDPGCKFDTCCVLKGPQGYRKSTAWQALASPQWFCDTPQENEKDLKLAIHTAWIYELAELDTLTSKREAGAVKALLSSATDRFRPPYASGMEWHPRRSILVGTCNRDDFLRDETGSRRFWIIEIPGRIDCEKIVADRDRIWRAAVLAYRDKKQPYLSHERQAESEQRNLGFAPEHPWLGAVERWMEKAPEAFSSDQALTLSGCRQEGQIRRGDEMEIAAILKSLGYVRDQHQTRVDGGRGPRLWRLPKPPSNPAHQFKTKPAEESATDSIRPSQHLTCIQGRGGEGEGGGSHGQEAARPARIRCRVRGEPGWSRPNKPFQGPSSICTNPNGQTELVGVAEIQDEA